MLSIKRPYAAIIGAGPAGLMAAEALARAGIEVHIFDAMPSFGRKFLLAGRGGLNLTHSEPYERFLEKFGRSRAFLEPYLDQFRPEQVRSWAATLGIETFVGSSGRVFPKELKTSPLLRSWLRQLTAKDVIFHARHCWTGWNGKLLTFETANGRSELEADVTILALGGASWPRLGSNAAWVSLLREHGVTVHDLKPANCGFDIEWSEIFAGRYAGAPVKSVTVTFEGASRRGEFVVTQNGVEGGVIYALSASLRDQIALQGKAELLLDLAPDRSFENVRAALQKPRGSRSFATHLARAGFTGVKAGLLREVTNAAMLAHPDALAKIIKALPFVIRGVRPISEAVSSAGGVAAEALDQNLMLSNLPGVFCAGEMLDWEAPTGGYLLTACLATGLAAGDGALNWLADRGSTSI